MKRKISRKVGIDIGCGTRKTPGTIGIDRRPVAGVNILADVKSLPLQSNCIDAVFSNHTIEHFAVDDLLQLIEEWTRVLKPKGLIDISCPDLRTRALMFFLFPSWNRVRLIYGLQDYQENFHKSGFSFGLLKELLESCGIERVVRINDGYRGISFLRSGLRVRGRKRS